MKPRDVLEAELGETPAAPATSFPIRTCVGCRQAHCREHLMRLVCGPTSHLMIDPYGKLPGRGAYVCLRRTCIEQALKGTLLQQAFGQEIVSAPVDEFVHKLVNTLEERAIACIHMARKAGRAVSGYARVMRALAHDPVTLLLVAEDTAPARRRAYAMWCEKRQIPSHSFLVKTRLGALVGRDESSGIGILDTRLSERLRCYLEGMSRLMER